MRVLNSLDHFSVTVLACCCLLAAMAIPHFRGHVYSGNDLSAFHLPVRAFYARCLNNGEAFDWMPSLFSGFYLTGEGQAGTYHPWHWLLYRFLPLRTAFNVELLASYPWMLMGMFWFLKRLVGRRDAALYGALVFTFSGFNMFHFVHPNPIAIVAHIPWLLLAIDVVVRDDPSWRALLAEAAIPLLTASQLLLGSPQYVWFSLVAEGCYAVFVLCSNRDLRIVQEITVRGLLSPLGRGWVRGKKIQAVNSRSILSSCFTIITLKFLGLMIGSVQLVPTFDLLTDSVRQIAGTENFHTGALHPLNLLQLVGPYFLKKRVIGGSTLQMGFYLGAMPLTLLTWLIVTLRSSRKRDYLVASVALFGLVAFLLALGKFGMLYHLQTTMPVIGKFRVPARYTLLVHLAVATLAAMAFVRLGENAREDRSKNDGPMSPFRNGERSGEERDKTDSYLSTDPKSETKRAFDIWAIPRISIIVAIAAVVMSWFDDLQRVASLPLILAGPFLLSCAGLILARAQRGTAAAVNVLILFTAIDLGIYGLSYNVIPGSRPNMTPRMADPPGKPGDRVVAHASTAFRGGNRMTLRGWNQVDGYAGLPPVSRLLQSRTLKGLQVAAVRWVARGGRNDEIPGLIPRTSDWWEVPDPAPRARLMTKVRPSTNVSRDLSTTPDDTALVETAIPALAGQPGEAVIIVDRPGFIRVGVTAASRQLLVLSERYHPGWRVRSGERIGSVLRVYGDFLGCVIEPGAYEVALSFQPASLRQGKLATLAGLILLLAYLVFRLRYLSKSPSV